MEFDSRKYYRYEEMKALLEGWAEEYRDIMTLSSIGKTYDGREIFLATVTMGGTADQKPAVLIDGGLHSRELIGSQIALYALHEFLEKSRTKEDVRQILSEKTLYVIPRINADGMEENLVGRGNHRGSKKKLHEEEDGIYAADVDGDGQILKMRIPAQGGEWKCCPDDPRLMVRRMPEDTEGPFYHVFTEGFLRGPKTEPLRQARTPYDRDPNREFPFGWDRHILGETYRESAGNYPLEDEETRALADFIVHHNNISTCVDEHSYMGAYISPMEFFKEIASPPDDSMTFYALGKEAAAETGYLYTNIFPLGLQGAAPGSFTPWLYFDRGIAAWCNENWNTRQLYDTVDAEHPVEKMEPFMSPDEITRDRLAILKHDTEENGGRSFVPWHTFSHPQLGEVELGGLRENYVIWNPPESHMEEECRRSYGFIRRCIDAAPQLVIDEVRVESGTEKACTRVTVKLRNRGRFPVFGTRRALNEKLTTTGTVRLTAMGREPMVKELPEIMGGMSAEITLDDIKGATGEKVTAEVFTERAGCLKREAVLPG